MPATPPSAPRNIPQVMVSSTFTDLKEHREALIDAINQHKLHPNVMEYDSAKLIDVIESSLNMVRDSAGYIGVISLKYGQTPECPNRNPSGLSITELEFNEAQRLNRPILLFIMGEDHLVKKADVEKDAAKQAKLDAFRERAKKSSSGVNRVYAVFNDIDEFKNQTTSSLAELCKHLDKPADTESREERAAPAAPAAPEPGGIPKPPAFYREPDYIGSHKFVGRESQLQELDDWARAADPTNLLLFEAIGGNGKSMLTWEWANNHATRVRGDWAGRFWYSFYERGAIMADFCQRALAYMTGTPLSDLKKKKTAELREPLLAQLHEKPWLLILDGLERVLVAYHRIDAAEVPDEEANQPTDKIANRNPCDAIRDEDSELLRSLAAAAPSKILVSTRLTPRILLNASGQAIDGAKRITLPGLRPADAEKLLRQCEVKGNSEAIQKYLTANCDNHPLVIGVLAGLIRNYLKDRGNFDRWAADRDGGAKLNLAKLNLVQRRNHILTAALAVLPKPGMQLLSTLALLSESVDYETLSAFNPHLPQKPQEVPKPEPPGSHWSLGKKSESEKAAMWQDYKAKLALRQKYERTLDTWEASDEVRKSTMRLEETVRDLEERGLLQYDASTKQHDLHPVVRGVAAGGMKQKDKERYGRRVVDHFSSQPHNPYSQADTLEDVRTGLSVVRTLLKLSRFQEAAVVMHGDLLRALNSNLEAYVEMLTLLRPFFPDGWNQLPKEVSPRLGAYLATFAGNSLSSFLEHKEALVAYEAAIRIDIEIQDWVGIFVRLSNIAGVLAGQNKFARTLQINDLYFSIGAANNVADQVYGCRLQQFFYASHMGRIAEVEETWKILSSMSPNKSSELYSAGEAENNFAWHQYRVGTLREEHLAVAERVARDGRNRHAIRSVYCLRGESSLDQRNWSAAMLSFQEAVRMARERSILDPSSETGLALSKFHSGQLAEPRREAERLEQLRELDNRWLAELWLAIGDHEKACQHALTAYKNAWADGEPYVRRFELNRATELLQRLNIEPPKLPPYDPAKDEKFPWEDDLALAIEKLRKEKEKGKSRTD